MGQFDVDKAKVKADNEAAATVPIGSKHDSGDLFGVITLVATSEVKVLGWDYYIVNHSGRNHHWASATVRATFLPDDTTHP